MRRVGFWDRVPARVALPHPVAVHGQVEPFGTQEPPHLLEHPITGRGLEVEGTEALEELVQLGGLDLVVREPDVLSRDDDQGSGDGGAGGGRPGVRPQSRDDDDCDAGEQRCGAHGDAKGGPQPPSLINPADVAEVEKELSQVSLPPPPAAAPKGPLSVVVYQGNRAAQKFPIAAGLLRREKTTLFVSRGVGTIYVPVRINCPPEVAVLTLQNRKVKPLRQR